MVRIMKVLFKKRSIEIGVRKLSAFGRLTGLMFKSRACDNLLFEFERDKKLAFHSFFCFFPFLILWLDSKNKVLDLKIANPFEFRIATSKPFRKVVELPLNKENIKIIDFFVGKERFK